jgi:hypothetical protein
MLGEADFKISLKVYKNGQAERLFAEAVYGDGNYKIVPLNFQRTFQ